MVNRTKAPTIEGILQRRDIRVFKFDVVVCPPGNPFPIKRHQVSLPVDVLKQLEGVFKKQTKARIMTSLMQQESLPEQWIYGSIVPLNMLFATDPQGTIGLLLLSSL